MCATKVRKTAYFGRRYPSRYENGSCDVAHPATRVVIVGNVDKTTLHKCRRPEGSEARTPGGDRRHKMPGTCATRSWRGSARSRSTIARCRHRHPVAKGSLSHYHYIANPPASVNSSSCSSLLLGSGDGTDSFRPAARPPKKGHLRRPPSTLHCSVVLPQPDFLACIVDRAGAGVGSAKRAGDQSAASRPKDRQMEIVTSLCKHLPGEVAFIVQDLIGVYRIAAERAWISSSLFLASIGREETLRGCLKPNSVRRRPQARLHTCSMPASGLHRERSGRPRVPRPATSLFRSSKRTSLRSSCKTQREEYSKTGSTGSGTALSAELVTCLRSSIIDQ